MRATMQFHPQSTPNSPQRHSKSPAANHEVTQLPKLELLGFVSLFCSVLLILKILVCHKSIGLPDDEKK